MATPEILQLEGQLIQHKNVMTIKFQLVASCGGRCGGRHARAGSPHNSKGQALHNGPRTLNMSRAFLWSVEAPRCLYVATLANSLSHLAIVCCQGVYLTFEWAVSVTKHAHTDSLCSYLLVARNLMSHTCPWKSILAWVETRRTKKNINRCYCYFSCWWHCRCCCHC